MAREAATGHATSLSDMFNRMGARPMARAVLVLVAVSVGPLAHAQQILDPLPKEDAPAPADEVQAATEADAERAPSAAIPSVQVIPSRRGAYRLHRWSFALARTRLEILDARVWSSLEDAVRARRASLVINAGFFSRDGEPVGLSRSGGRTFSSFATRLGGGVLTLAAGRANLHDVDRFMLPDATDFAVQCRPRLVVDGASNIVSRRRSRADRTALCLRDGGATLDVFVARSDRRDAKGGPTLRELARMLAARGCESALNLDGGPSTAVAWRDRSAIRTMPPRGAIVQAIAVHTTE